MQRKSVLQGNAIPSRMLKRMVYCISGGGNLTERLHSCLARGREGDTTVLGVAKMETSLTWSVGTGR
jgi:hypothetical protein